ncbi:MAG TPA: ABC transporter permease [Kofleriaceae bacterium]|nr:ABC transporter permease [Kofleriaceae bacterium]
MSWVRRVAADRAAVVGLALFAALVAIAVVGPLLTADPLARDLDHGLTARGAPLGPSAGALLGTDPLGRDVWARLVAGAGTSLSIAAGATTLALVLGLAVGVVAGYRGGWVDGVLMRTVDLTLAFPALLLAILVAAVLRETSLATSRAPVVLVLALVSWGLIARMIRAKAMSVARSPHVLAARALGASPRRIVMRHVLPQLVGVITIAAVATFAQVLLNESALSFLGLGPPPPAPTWGRMLYEGRAYYRSAPHLVIAPGLAIVVAVAAVHLIAQGLRSSVEEPR